MDNVSKEYDFIMVGTWSYQKGCDLIVEAIRRTNYTFLHVGAIGDLSFPADSQFRHIPPVDQKELYKYYAKAKVFVLPSRQDGLAMVLVQAVACHLPIIASPDGGACDIKEKVANPDCISIIDDFSWVDKKALKSIPIEIDRLIDKYQSYIPLSRKEAINKAIKMAKENDIVLILGKGNENYQKIGKEVIHFNDIEEAKKAINERNSEKN